MTPLEKFKKAVDLVKSKGLDFDVEIPASSEEIKTLETWAKHDLPPSYKAALVMLGVPMFEGMHMYGIGRGGVFVEGGSGVWFQTNAVRKEGILSESMLHIASAGYGPIFALDFDTIGMGGEPVVRLVGLSGYKEDSEIVAQSFGDFFYDEIKAEIEDVLGDDWRQT